MKILFLTDNFPPEVNAPATRTFEHCVEWVKLGAEITVITGVPNFPQGKVYPGHKNRIRQVEIVQGIRVIRVWTYITQNKGFFKRTIDYISFMVTSFLAGLWVKADIIIATSPQFFTVVSGALLSFIKRTPWVMEVRDLWPDSIIGVEAVRSKKLLGFLFWLEKRLYNSANLIITVTETFKQEIISKGIDSSKIEVVKNGSNLDLFKPKLPDLSLKKQLDLSEYFIVSYIGTHGMAHGLDFIINCISDLEPHNIFFLFIGDGANKEELVTLAKKKNVSNVRFLDPIPKHEIPEYLALSDISLIPLRKAKIFTTVIPSKIFESAAMNIPILLGVEGESKDIITQYQAGLSYEPENKTEFINQLLKIKNDPQLYERCQQGGARLSVDYDRKKLAKELYALLNTIHLSKRVLIPG